MIFLLSVILLLAAVGQVQGKVCDAADATALRTCQCSVQTAYGCTGSAAGTVVNIGGTIFCDVGGSTCAAATGSSSGVTGSSSVSTGSSSSSTGSIGKRQSPDGSVPDGSSTNGSGSVPDGSSTNGSGSVPDGSSTNGSGSVPDGSSTNGSGSVPAPAPAPSTCCTACDPATLACTGPAIAFQTGANQGACAELAPGTTITGGSSFDIVRWTLVNSPTGFPADLTTAWTGTFTASATTVFDGVFSALTATKGSRSFEIGPGSTCGATSVTFTVVTRKRQVTPLTLPAPLTFAAASAISADPHLRGPFGSKFDVKGVDNGTYVLFESPGQFRVTMTLMSGGPKAHFIHRVDITLFDAAGHSLAVPPLSIWAHPKDFVETTRKLVQPFGARVGGKPVAITIDTDQGVRFIVTQFSTHLSDKQNPKDDGKLYHYVDVDVDVPGCSETFDGILGQLYHCRYEDGLAKFVWHDGDEEAFRVKA